MRRFHDEDLSGAEFRECDLSRTRMVGCGHAGRRDRRPGHQPRGQRRRGHAVRRGGARPPSSRPAADPLGPAGRPAGGLAAAAGRLGDDHRTGSVHCRRAASTRASTASGRWSRRCATSSSCTTRGSGAACSGSPSRSRPWGWALPSVVDHGAGRPRLVAAQPSLDAVLAVRARQAVGGRGLARRGHGRPTRPHGTGAGRRPMASVRHGADRAAVPRDRARRGVGSPPVLRRATWTSCRGQPTSPRPPVEAWCRPLLCNPAVCGTVTST